MIWYDIQIFVHKNRCFLGLTSKNKEFFKKENNQNSENNQNVQKWPFINFNWVTINEALFYTVFLTFSCGPLLFCYFCL